MSDADDYVKLKMDGAVGTLTLNSPGNRNAITVERWERLSQALLELESNRLVRTAVLTGAGPGFCAGADIKANAAMMADADAATIRLAHQRMLHTVRRLRESRLIVVGSVHGSAYGAGFSLALACDLLVSTPDTKFSAMFMKIGLVPDMSCAWMLARTLGAHRARALVYRSEVLTGQQAFEAGLVHQLHATPEAALAAAQGVAEQIAATPSSTLAFGKMLLMRGEEMGLEDTMALEQATQALVLRESAEGFLNALNKR